MNNTAVEQILSATGTACVSVIVPTHRFPEEKSKDPKILSKAIGLAKDKIRERKMPEELISKLEELYKQVKFSHIKDGLGLYVSPGISEMLYFPFPVTERISAGDHFAGRELLYYKNLPEYHVLSVSKKQINLYQVKGEEWHEIINEDFPKIYHDTYEYSTVPRHSSSNSYGRKSFERDKSDLQEIRLKTFFRSADHALNGYIGNSMLLLCGVTEEISIYKHLSKHSKQIIGHINGNYEHDKKRVSLASWEFMQKYMEDRNGKLLSTLKELIGEQKAVSGIKPVLDAVQEGRGLTLLIEKDIEPYFHRSPEQPFDHNLADQVIRQVLEKKGQINFMNNGMLKDMGGIALILRYNNKITAP